MGGCLALAGCAALRPRGASEWLLLHPPEVADAASPRGRRLLTRAPRAEWHEVGSFATGADCEQARQAAARAAIAAGGPDAPRELAVRRAVNASCVSAAPGASGAAPRP